MHPAPEQTLTQTTTPTRAAAPLAAPAPTAGPGQLARAVFWSIFGVRGSRARHRDFASITLPQAMLAGLLGTAAFALLLIGVVRLVLERMQKAVRPGITTAELDRIGQVGTILWRSNPPSVCRSADGELAFLLRSRVSAEHIATVTHGVLEAVCTQALQQEHAEDPGHIARPQHQVAQHEQVRHKEHDPDLEAEVVRGDQQADEADCDYRTAAYSIAISRDAAGKMRRGPYQYIPGVS